LCKASKTFVQSLKNCGKQMVSLDFANNNSTITKVFVLGAMIQGMAFKSFLEAEEAQIEISHELNLIDEVTL